uniref:PDZ domain-containing protein n=1 Tax=Rhodnius prolixus TaxID=13249 RepID=T1HCG9_RHOPR
MLIIPREIVRPNKAPPSPPLKRDRPSTTTNTTTPKLAEQRKLKSTVDLRTLEFGCCQQSVDNVSTTLPRTERTGMTGTGLTRAVSFTSGTKLHSRSQSLVDVGTRTSLIKDDSRRLSTMIEQRKRCMSKLRGLVIPEKVAEVPHFVDLPEIKSRDCTLPESTPDKEQTESVDVQSCTMSNATVVNKLPSSPLISSPPWKSADSNLPKYSPAFKRKSLTIYDAHYQPSNGVNTGWFGLNQETKGDQYLDVIPSRPNMKQRATSPVHTKVIEIRDEESDCDSAVSSSRSDLSHSPTSELSRVSRTLSDDTNTSTEPTLTATSSLITTDRPAQQDRTSLNNDRELSQLIEEANHTLEESHEVVVVILHRDNPGGSIGITLAGGADYEAKEITVHKVLVGSPAERDGRIQKGDRILSINGKSMKGLTHYESLAILKAPRPEVVLVVSRHKSDPQDDTTPLRCHTNTLRSPRFIEPPKFSSPPSDKENELKWGPIESVTLHKDGAGLGFSLEGGKDSPYGDMPLTIKKIFTGGCAEKSGLVYAGDELLTVNGHDVSGLSRIEAWALMKRLPDGRVTLAIRHPIHSAT